MNITQLDNLSKEARKRIIAFHYFNKRSHCASSLSCIDIIIHLYFNKMLEGDTFILSKGHASSALYTTLDMKGYPVPAIYPTHPERNIEGGVFCSTGSLGHGLPIGCGVAIAKPKNQVFVLVSDGELNEGSTWEAVQFAQHKRLTNLTLLIDNNGWQASGRCQDTINLRPLAPKFEAFGFAPYVLNGNSHEDLGLALALVLNKPKVLICNTKKCCGIDKMEDSNELHYRPPTKEEYENSIL